VERVGDGPVVGPSASATPPAALRIAASIPASLDPRDLDTQDSLLLASQVFDGLVAYDTETLDVVPAVAETWEVADDGRTFTFRIRPGATFHDGSTVTASSFVTAWNRLADPVVSRPYAFLLESVEGFRKYQDELTVRGLSGLTAPDERTLEVRLSRAWTDFVSLLAHPALSPVPATAGDASFATQPIGNGPYQLSAPITTASQNTLQAFTGYYGVPPALASLEVHPVATPDAAWPEFLSGGLDVAEMPAPLFREARATFGERGVTPLARLLWCGFNEADGRFASRALRIAASLALDREAIVADVFGGIPLPATGIVPPSIPGHTDGVCGEGCRRDLERAAAVLADVPKQDRTFALDYASSGTGDQLAGAIAAQLGEIGLSVTPRPHDETSFETVLEADQHEMFCLAGIADAPRQQALLEPILAGGSPDNHAGIADPDLDALLEEARTRRDAAARRELYVEVERAALTAMHVIPVLWFRSRLAVQPYVEGFSLDPLGLYEASTISLGAEAPSSPAPPMPEPPAVPGVPGAGDPPAPPG
jgi:ABC-type transport system substrate-binding protein